jgi:hypothetical protein
MPILRGHCGKGKPLTSVGLAPALPRPGAVGPSLELPPFPITKLTALLDTGADGTCITSAVARSHKLEHLGMRSVIGVGGGNYHATWGMFLGFYFNTSAEFEGEIHHSDNFFMIDEPLLAIEIPPNGEFDVIVGRDILLRYGFHLKRGGAWEMDLG